MTTSSQEIVRALSSVSRIDPLRRVPKSTSFFRGVFPNNRLVNQMPLRRGECLIVNLEDSGLPGSHWVGCYGTRDFGNVYIDSFGWPPTQEVDNFLNRSGGYRFLGIEFQTLSGQGADLCGEFQVWFSYYFLTDRFEYGIQQLDWKPSPENNRKVLELFRRLTD